MASSTCLSRVSRVSLRDHALRSYATAVEPARLGRTHGDRKVLSLDHFLQRQRVLNLWREIVRETNKIADKNTRHEMRQFARHEFERYRNVDDLGHIRYLISTGKEQVKSMSRYMDQMQSF